jgi:hypothetical protein
LIGCAATESRQPGPVVQNPLALSRVELYRSGVGYFERAGVVQGSELTLKVRKDQINDLLKSLTVIDRSSGKVLSVSLPLDPKAWQNAAQAKFTEGVTGLGELLHTLRGSSIRVRYGIDDKNLQEVQGRIMSVDAGDDGRALLGLLDQSTVHLVDPMQIRSVTLFDGDVAMQLHRNLDAAMGEGMFQQVEVVVRLNEAPKHEVLLSYVVEAPKWKPTYRLVLDSQDSGKALLQAWAIVDNTSGESWEKVHLSLTSGAPIAFRYNLHTPQNVFRPDMTRNQTDRQANVAIEQASNTARMPLSAPPPAPAMEKRSMARGGKAKSMELGEASIVGGLADVPSAVYSLSMDEEVSEIGIDPSEYADALAGSTQTRTDAVRVSGMTQYRLQDKVTLPNGSASMVSLINQKVSGKEFFLFNQGGSGRGFEFNPYRVVRFQNETPFALEPGPLSVYTDGHFVGEGITDVVGASAVTTIPFAVESGITVSNRQSTEAGEHTLLRIFRGTLITERIQRQVTRWLVRGKIGSAGYTVMVKHRKQGGTYELKSKHEGLEDAPNEWLIPIQMPMGLDSVEIKVVEESPVERQVSFWDTDCPRILDTYLKLNKVSPDVLKVLSPILAKRQEMASAADKIQNLQQKQRQYDSRLSELRQNLEAISKDKKADTLREKLSKDLLDFTEKSNALGRDIVELKDRELVLKIELQELVKDLTLDKLR